MSSFDAERVRKDFPILSVEVHGKPLVFLDSAASAQKPECVIQAVSDMYRLHYANVERGVYELSRQATEILDETRRKVADFIGAPDPHEVIFVRNATEGINLVAYSYGRQHVGEGDEVLITHMEHHANIVPWQILCEERGATLRVAPIDDRGELMVEEFAKLLTPRTKIAAFAHVSNALGTINPVRDLVEMAHDKGVPVLVDGAQAVPHQRVDVRSLGCDFYAFSGHKLFAPSGVGVLWGRRELLEAMPPFLSGGSMIQSVSFEKTIFQGIPHRGEAGTPDIGGLAGLGAAIDYVTDLGLDEIAAYEQELLAYATTELSKIPGLTIIGTAAHKAAVVSFVLDGVHPHDIGTILDQEGVAVRTGHHCAQPVMQRYGVPATVRASFAFYNTKADVDALVRALGRVREVFGA